MNRTQKFLYNSISTALYQVIVMLAGFITPKIMLSYYGSELNGLVSSINQFITYFSLVEAGIAGAAVYSLYKPLATNNYTEINSIVSAAKKFYLKSGGIFTFLVIALAIIYPFFIKTSELSYILIFCLILVLGAKGFLEFFTLAKYRVLLTADQKTYVISNASSVYIILQTVLIFILSFLRYNIVIVYTVAIFALFSRTIILMLYVKKHYKYINYNATPDYSSLNKRWDALILQGLGVVQTGAPVIIATIFTSLKSVSVYTIYNMVFSGINGVLSIFINGLSASFGDVIARNEKEKLKKVYLEFEYLYCMIISIVFSVSFYMIMPFIRIYTSNITDINYNQPILGFLFVLNGLLYSIKNPQGTLVISAGHYKETKLQTMLQALIIVIGGIILTPTFGLVGLLIASCISNLYRDIDLLFYIPKYVTHTKVSQTLKHWLMLILIIVCNLLIYNLFDIYISSFVSWILYAIVLVSIGIIVGLIVGVLFDKKILFSICNRLGGILKNGKSI